MKYRREQKSSYDVSKIVWKSFIVVCAQNVPKSSEETILVCDEFHK